MEMNFVPDATFYMRVRDESIGGDNPFRWDYKTSKEIFLNKRVVVFSLPGAFTPTCSTFQVPGFEKAYDEIPSLVHADGTCRIQTVTQEQNPNYYNLIKAFGDGTGTLTDMVSAIPGIGSVLGMFTGYLDNTLTVFQQLSSSGASFNNNLTLLRTSAAGAKVSLESFASLIGSNTEGLAAFGGTVTQGAIMFGKARTALNKYEGDLLNMGLTFEEINEGLMDYMTLNRAGSRGQQQDMAALAEGSAMYSKSLLTLSKLAGKDIKAQKEALKNTKK